MKVDGFIVGRVGCKPKWVHIESKHIGSTAVPGPVAKPIIDILLVVADSTDEALETLEECRWES